MKVVYSEEKNIADKLNALETYRVQVRALVDAAQFEKPESALATWQDELLRVGVGDIKKKLGKVKHVILVGIGGSSLGTEALYEALRGEETPTLHVLDCIADYKISRLLDDLENTTREDVAVCIISKSGGTTETMSNASVLLSELNNLYQEAIYDRCVCIGNQDNLLLSTGSDLGMHTLPMHESIGGRYSVFTAVGLLPLALLEFDINSLLDGLKMASSTDEENKTAEDASRLMLELESGIRQVNFFAFEPRLEKMGAWYRQLAAESLGKEKDRDGNQVTAGFVPTISTPVELHSIGQLYFSGFSGVYTDFVSLDDRLLVHYVSEESKLAPQVAGKSLSEVAYAIEGGVVKAYQARKLPFRHTKLDKLDAHNAGLFMGKRMLETIYLAELMNVNAFDQPNVEIYKEKTKEILDNGQHS